MMFVNNMFHLETIYLKNTFFLQQVLRNTAYLGFGNVNCR